MRAYVLGPLATVGRATTRSLGSVGRAWDLLTGAFRSLRNVDVWGPHLLPQMARVGVWMNLIGLAVIAIFVAVILPMIWTIY